MTPDADTLQTAPDTHEENEAVHRTAPVLWDTVAGWSRFSRIDVTNMDVTSDVLGVTPGGAATIEATGPDGSDRRIYQLDGFTGEDMEARVTYEAEGGAQIGVALRVNPAASLVAWQNILFAATASILRGAWEWVSPGDTGVLATNDHGPSTPAQAQEVISADGDGTTVTVRSALPHLLSRTVDNGVKVDTGPFDGSATYPVTVVDATTFEFPSPVTGSWTGGTWSQDRVVVANDIRRHIKARIVGDLFQIGHWFDNEAEPTWGDPLRTTAAALPAALGMSGNPPPASGGVGLMVGHLGESPKTLTIYEFDVRAL